jgi:hypothetical protein
MKKQFCMFVLLVLELSASSSSELVVRSEPVSAHEENNALQEIIRDLCESRLELDSANAYLLAKFAATLCVESHKKATDKDNFYNGLLALREELIELNNAIEQEPGCNNSTVLGTAKYPDFEIQFPNYTIQINKQICYTWKDGLTQFEKVILKHPWGHVIEDTLKKDEYGNLENPAHYVDENMIAGTWIAHLQVIKKTLVPVLLLLRPHPVVNGYIGREPIMKIEQLQELPRSRVFLKNKAEKLDSLVDFFMEAAYDKKIGREFKNLVRKVNDELKEAPHNPEKKRRT